MMMMMVDDDDNFYFYLFHKQQITKIFLIILNSEMIKRKKLPSHHITHFKSIILLFNQYKSFKFINTKIKDTFFLNQHERQQNQLIFLLEKKNISFFFLLIINKKFKKLLNILNLFSSLFDKIQSPKKQSEH
ncbi:hypothetical protein ABPG72_007883 [Tetrahymena utriculariae]